MKEASKNNKAQGLGSVVRLSFIKSALIPILTVELALLCLYFYGIDYVTSKNLDLLRSNALETVSEITKTEAKSFNDQLREISRNNRSLQVEHQALFNSSSPSSLISKFTLHSRDELIARLNSENSSVFISSKTDLAPQIVQKALKTKQMDVRFATLVDNNPNLVSGYFISKDNLIRTYPIVEDFYKQYPRNFDVTTYNFYYMADEARNPRRQDVWTNTYLDPSGKGWMLSNLVPIYRGDILEGVTGLDVTLSTFSQHILSNDLQWDSGALVMDMHGNIVTMSKSAERYLGLQDISDYNAKDKLLGRSQTQPTKFNLLKQNTMTGMYFSEFFNGKTATMEFNMHGEDYLLTKHQVAEIGWQLFVLAPLDNVYGPVISAKEKVTQIGIAILALTCVFYAIFFVYLKRSLRRLALRITKPIAQITRMITNFESGDIGQVSPNPVNIKELDTLLSMNLEIQKSKRLFERISQEMKIKNKQLKVLAITDQLTQVYNRLKLDEVLVHEMACAKRDRTLLAIALMDIDRFKSVNDTYGHQVGDSVLVGVAQIVLKHIRPTDIFGRWGGEEFLLILPNTTLEQAYERADKLRQLIKNSNFSPVKQLTISMGLASCADFSCEKMPIELADNALYEAKENGRDRVELAPLVASASNKTGAISM